MTFNYICFDMTVLSLSGEQKKAFLLLEIVIFNYHGLDREETRILEESATKLDALDELKWAMDFVGNDYYASYDRIREYLNQTVTLFDKSTRIDFLRMVWEGSVRKGYVTEMEAMAMLRIAKDWGVQKELLEIVRK